MLEWLSSRILQAKVPPLEFFRVKDWAKAPDPILERLHHRFAGGLVAVRSSAFVEDRPEKCTAGQFHSCLNVDANDRALLRDSIEKVIVSLNGHREDQVLVQEMVYRIDWNGVLSTRDLSTGSPYFLVSYDDFSKEAGSVTAGRTIPKTWHIWRTTPLERISCRRMRQLLKLATEIMELLADDTLEIEFAYGQSDDLFLLQVRPRPVSLPMEKTQDQTTKRKIFHLTRRLQDKQQPRHGIAGTGTLWGQMPDWNPVELLGEHPSPLAFSLFRYLISDTVWQKARSRMGYRAVPGEPLVLSLAGRPFVDVRNSFNSLLPATLSEDVAGKLVDAWIGRLAEFPCLHDKVEFEIAQSVMDPDFDQEYRRRYSDALTESEFSHYQQELLHLTRQLISCQQGSSIQQASQSIALFERYLFSRPERSTSGAPQSVLQAALDLLRSCRRLGTYPFAVIARHAFVAESMLRSLVRLEVLPEKRLNRLHQSWRTIASEISDSMLLVLQGKKSLAQFLSLFGHLRPSMFDITSPRYDQRPEIWEDTDGIFMAHRPQERTPFHLSPQDSLNIEKALGYLGRGDSAHGFLAYASQAITGRESAKFILSRALSNALELLAGWGEKMNLSRIQLSYCTWKDLVKVQREGMNHGTPEWLSFRLQQRQQEDKRNRLLHLPRLIRDRNDLYSFSDDEDCPSFVTDKRVEGKPIRLMTHGREKIHPAALSRGIVCTENADPGFDWIFVRNISGLITKWGGPNSHMAIRCAEKSIPAALGVGESRFQRLSRSPRILLNCHDRIVTPLLE